MPSTMPWAFPGVQFAHSPASRQASETLMPEGHKYSSSSSSQLVFLSSSSPPREDLFARFRATRPQSISKQRRLHLQQPAKKQQNNTTLDQHLKSTTNKMRFPVTAIIVCVASHLLPLALAAPAAVSPVCCRYKGVRISPPSISSSAKHITD